MSPADTDATSVLVARCENVHEPDGTPCTGRLSFHWGQSDAACDTCGARCGIAVADWLAVRPADTDLTARLAEVLAMSRNRQMDAAALLPVVREYGDQRAAEALEAAADAADDGDWQGQQYGTHPVTRLRDRAAALRGEAGR